MSVQRERSNLVNAGGTFMLTKWPGETEGGLEVKLRKH